MTRPFAVTVSRMLFALGIAPLLPLLLIGTFGCEKLQALLTQDKAQDGARTETEDALNASAQRTESGPAAAAEAELPPCDDRLLLARFEDESSVCQDLRERHSAYHLECQMQPLEVKADGHHYRRFTIVCAGDVESHCTLAITTQEETYALPLGVGSSSIGTSEDSGEVRDLRTIDTPSGSLLTFTWNESSGPRHPETSLLEDEPTEAYESQRTWVCTSPPDMACYSWLTSLHEEILVAQERDEDSLEAVVERRSTARWTRTLRLSPKGGVELELDKGALGFTGATAVSCRPARAPNFDESPACPWSFEFVYHWSRSFHARCDAAGQISIEVLQPGEDESPGAEFAILTVAPEEAARLWKAWAQVVRRQSGAPRRVPFARIRTGTEEVYWEPPSVYAEHSFDSAIASPVRDLEAKPSPATHDVQNIRTVLLALQEARDPMRAVTDLAAQIPGAIADDHDDAFQVRLAGNPIFTGWWNAAGHLVNAEFEGRLFRDPSIGARVNEPLRTLRNCDIDCEAFGDVMWCAGSIDQVGVSLSDLPFGCEPQRLSRRELRKLEGAPVVKYRYRRD